MNKNICCFCNVSDGHRDACVSPMAPLDRKTRQALAKLYDEGYQHGRDAKQATKEQSSYMLGFAKGRADLVIYQATHESAYM